MKHSLNMLLDIEIIQFRMKTEQKRQGRILLNLYKYLLDNPTNLIVIEEESVNFFSKPIRE